jgi:peptidoglycan/xylan/chitin deacetylase (PgdA/CDA1 family)
VIALRYFGCCCCDFHSSGLLVGLSVGFVRMKSRLGRLRCLGSVTSARSQRSISFASERSGDFSSSSNKDDVAEEENNRDDGDGNDTCLWLMGTLVEGRQDRVEWTWHNKEDVWDTGTNVAHVLWNSQGVMEFACSTNSPSDVAAILKAYEIKMESMETEQRGMPSSNHDGTSSSIKIPQSTITTTATTIIDRDAVNQQVAEGSLPSVPPYSAPATQWALIQIMKRIFHRPSVSFFAAAPLRMTSLYHFETDHKNIVALTIDDAPCRFATLENSRMTQVLDLLKQYNNAKATFMMVHSFASQPAHEHDLLRALQEGHEFANHGIRDESFKNSSPDEFSQAVDQCNNLLVELHQKAGLITTTNEHDNHNHNNRSTIKWFRAPHSYYTQEMEDILQQKGMRNVMCDAYASCPIVQDSDAIAESILRQVQPGSIILIHMPERGFRDWTLPALEKVLQGLQERNITVCTLSQMEAMSLSVAQQQQQQQQQQVNN